MFHNLKQKLAATAISVTIALLCCFSNVNVAPVIARQITSWQETGSADFSNKENAEKYRNTLLLDYQINRDLCRKYQDEDRQYAEQCRIRANRIAKDYSKLISEYKEYWEEEDILYVLPYIMF